MANIRATIPETVLDQARELAKRDGVTLDQLISLAVAQSVGAWSQPSCLAMRRKRASRAKFLRALAQVPDTEPPDYDRLPSAYRSRSKGGSDKKVHRVKILAGREKAKAGRQ